MPFLDNHSFCTTKKYLYMKHTLLTVIINDWRICDAHQRQVPIFFLGNIPHRIGIMDFEYKSIQSVECWKIYDWVSKSPLEFIQNEKHGFKNFKKHDFTWCLGGFFKTLKQMAGHAGNKMAGVQWMALLVVLRRTMMCYFTKALNSTVSCL